MLLNTLLLPKSTNDLNNGLIHFFQRKHQENLYHIEASSVLDNVTDQWGGPHVLLDYSLNEKDPTNEWCSQNYENSSFTIFFYEMKVRMTHYTFKSRTFNPADMPNGWVVEGSDNNKTWIEIDKQQTNELQNAGVIKTFEINNKKHAFKCFRFTQILPNTNTRNIFSLAKVDFYGEIFNSFLSCKDSNVLNISILLCFFLIFI